MTTNKPSVFTEGLFVVAGMMKRAHAPSHDVVGSPRGDRHHHAFAYVQVQTLGIKIQSHRELFIVTRDDTHRATSRFHLRQRIGLRQSEPR